MQEGNWNLHDNILCNKWSLSFFSIVICSRNKLVNYQTVVKVKAVAIILKVIYRGFLNSFLVLYAN